MLTVSLFRCYSFLAEENFDLDLREDEEEEFAPAAAADEGKCCFNLVDFCFTLLRPHLKGRRNKGYIRKSNRRCRTNVCYSMQQLFSLICLPPVTAGSDGAK